MRPFTIGCNSSIAVAFFMLLGAPAAAGPIALDDVTPVTLDRSDYSWTGAANQRNAGTLVVTRTGRHLTVQVGPNDPRPVDIRNNALLPGAALSVSTIAYSSRGGADDAAPALAAPAPLPWPWAAGDGGNYSQAMADPVVERLALTVPAIQGLALTESAIEPLSFDDLDTAQVAVPFATAAASDGLAVGLLAVPEPPALALTALGLVLAFAAVRLPRRGAEQSTR